MERMSPHTHLTPGAVEPAAVRHRHSQGNADAPHPLRFVGGVICIFVIPRCPLPPAVTFLRWGTFTRIHSVSGRYCCRVRPQRSRFRL